MNFDMFIQHEMEIHIFITLCNYHFSGEKNLNLLLF